jgi:hypothetical protein
MNGVIMIVSFVASLVVSYYSMSDTQSATETQEVIIIDYEAKKP